MPKKAEAQTVTVEAEAEVKRLDLLEAFAELVAERFGYYTARKLKMAEMNEKTEAERKQASAMRKAISFRLKFDRKNGGYSYEIGDALREAMTSGNWEAYESKLKELSEVKKSIDNIATPYRKEMNSFNKALRYIDNVCIPDSLKELGHPIQPRFSLSDWVKKAIEQQRKRKK
jgi:hypothetical protein